MTDIELYKVKLTIMVLLIALAGSGCLMELEHHPVTGEPMNKYCQPEDGESELRHTVKDPIYIQNTGNSSFEYKIVFDFEVTTYEDYPDGKEVVEHIHREISGEVPPGEYHVINFLNSRHITSIREKYRGKHGGLPSTIPIEIHIEERGYADKLDYTWANYEGLHYRYGIEPDGSHGGSGPIVC